jgi:CBS domain-containing protein
VIVREAIVADPRTIPASANGREAAEALSPPHPGSVLVVDGDRLVGIVRRASIVEAVARGDDVAALTAADLAERNVPTIAPDAALDEALHLMAEGDLDSLAVTEDGRLLGVLPRGPIVRRLAEDEPPPEDEL